MAGQEVVQFDPQDSPSIAAAFSVMDHDKTIPKELVEQLRDALGAYISGGAAARAVLSRAKQLNHAVLTEVVERNELAAVRGAPKYYRREIDPETKEPKEDIYKPMDREELTKEVTRAYENITGTIDGNAIDNLVNSVDKKIRLDNTIAKADNTIIQLIPGNFWDMRDGSVYPSIPKGMRCFRKLFDTPPDREHGGKDIKHVVYYPEGTFDEYTDILEEYVENTYDELERSNGDLEEDPDFKFLQTVACGEHDRYMDLILMFATFFMGRKPLGAYILEGDGRNGKSGVVGLIHTLMGENNTSRLQLGELGNWHKNHCLADTLVNAPDEEKKKSLEDTDLFKVIADHGVIELDVMHGQKPLEVTCDFQCVSAANHLPQWPKGQDSLACIRRARIIPFRADLSGEDAKNINFEKLTYTPERMIHFLGVVLGVARYYLTDNRVFPESNGIKVMRQILQEDMVSYRLYYTSFISFFGKYHILKEVYRDYVNWCKSKGYAINKYEEFRDAYNNSRERPTSHSDNRVSLPNVYRVSNLQTCFYKDWICDELASYGTIEQINDAGLSIVSLMEVMRDRQKQALKGDKEDG